MTKSVTIFGGHGFVGTHIAKQLIESDIAVTCVSRRGECPQHLNNQDWAKSVTWQAGDASRADSQLLAQSGVVITVIGSPPLPTFTKTAHQRQLLANGLANQALITDCESAGVNKLIVLGAQIPFFLNFDWFAYNKGKQISLDAAKQFCQKSEENGATVIQPSMIYGTRHTQSGTAIPMTWLFKPVSKIFPSIAINVEEVAQYIANAAINEELKGFKKVPHKQLLDWNK